MKGIRGLGLAVLLTAWWLTPAALQGQQCVGDANGDNQVTIAELVGAVQNALQGCNASGLASISGTIVNAGDQVYRVWASGDSGTLQSTETEPGSGHFMLRVPASDWYVMGFARFVDPVQMHFAGAMVFPCANGEDDHFFMGSNGRGIDLGAITLHDDGSFARPQRCPLDQLDSDGDGIPDSEDPDSLCQDVGDHNHDGFYDDDTDHDGFHDDDADHDCIRDDEEQGHHGHPGPMM